MKILFINTLYYPNVVGGAERSVQILSESLVTKGHDVIVLSISNKKGVQSKIINGVKAYYIGLKNIYYPFQEKKNEIFRLCWHLIDIYNPLMAYQVSKIIHFEQPDIIHTNNLSGFSVSVWSTAKKHKVPLIHTVRDHYLPCYLSTMYKKSKNCTIQCMPCRFFSMAKKLKSNIPDTIIGISRYILDRHINLGFFTNVKNTNVIFNSCPDTKMPEHVNINNDVLRIGYLGRIEEKKGVELLLKTFSELRTNNAQLLIGGIGEKNYLTCLRKQYFLHKNISFMGFVNPNNFFNDLDVLVVPSLLNEAFGRTIVEAYQHGIPVIGSMRGGIPEIIKPNETGFLFDPDKPIDLSIIIKKIIKTPSIVHQMKCKCLYKSNSFSADTISKCYMDEYKKIV